MIFIRPFLKIHYVGKENIPKTGNLIICSNHISLLDPVLLAMGIKQQIYFMAKSEFFTEKGFFVKIFMKIVGAFPVKRNTSDIKSVSDAVLLLKHNKKLGIFPQGRIVKDNNFDMKSGAALLSIKTQTPVLPVSIYTNGKIGLFSEITVTFGEPVYPLKNEEKNSVKQARIFTEKIKGQIVAQLEAKHWHQ